MTESKPPEETKTFTLPEVLPILPLYNVFVFPKMMLPMEVVGEESMKLVDDAMARDRLIGLVKAKKPQSDEPLTAEDMYSVGTAGVILRMAKTVDNKAQLLVQGISRFKVLAFTEVQPYFKAKVAPIEEIAVKDLEVEALVANLKGAAEDLAAAAQRREREGHGEP